ncbi:MAG: LA2681 family HEPN domain-containing protein [Chloroflexota bacterium]
MTNKNEADKYNACSKLLDEGKYVEAVKLAESLSNAPFRAAIFIDGGFVLGDSSKVRKGTQIFEDMLLVDETTNGITKCSILYNAANGYSSLYSLKRRKGKDVTPPNDSDLRSAKNLYRQAIENLRHSEPSFASQVLINYGNCLSQFGRFIDAIEYYERAIQVDPTNGMAAGNLGIELEHASRITGRYRHEYIALAHDFLKQALSPKMHLRFGSPQAVKDFQSRLKGLEHFINANKKPILLPKPAEAHHKNKNQIAYIQFCINNGLFLNAWAGNKEISPGITDDISFGGITTPIGDNHLVPELLRILNEIKESYTTARYLYFLSQSKTEILDNVSQTAIYFDNFDYSINGVYTGLCKTAYSRAFDVLDKVARIVNTYFGIGKRESTFWNIFAEKQSQGETHEIRFIARKTICDTQNPSMYALADLCIDYFEDAKVDFKTIDARRNRITHDYLNVKLYVAKDDNTESVIGLNELRRQTKDVLRLAKYAVLYAVSSINIAEMRKKTSDERVMPIIYDGKPGDTFLG